jgi:glucoamylase
VAVAGVAFLSGGSESDPRTPVGLAGLPAPFLGTAVVGSGGLTAAIDAYGDVVDMRSPGPAGAALIDNPADRQAAGSVSPGTGIVPLVRIGEGPAQAMWEADSIRQRYLPGTNVVRTTAVFALGLDRAAKSDRLVKVEITDAARGQELARLVRAETPAGVATIPSLSVSVEMQGRAGCAKERRGSVLAVICSARPQGKPSDAGRAGGGRSGQLVQRAQQLIAAASAEDRRWLSRARPLRAQAPPWARRMYSRSLLVLRALTDRHTGAVAAGLRDGWAYVWPRDAGAVAMALAASGYRAEARRVAQFLVDLDLGAAARFTGEGIPVPGRSAQGDARGWVRVALRAADPSRPPPPSLSDDRADSWRDRSDYQEGAPGNYLANAIASSDREPEIAAEFGDDRGLVRRAGDPGSGLDSAAAWAVRPFPQPALFPAARRTLLQLAQEATPFGITPSQGWPHADPWTAPTAWSAWSLAALGERRAALRLLTALRRAATPAGNLPERVDAHTGISRSTTPLAWSHAFAILALRELWPRPRGQKNQSAARAAATASSGVSAGTTPGAPSIASRPFSSQLRSATTVRPIALAKPISESVPHSPPIAITTSPELTTARLRAWPMPVATT